MGVAVIIHHQIPTLTVIKSGNKLKSVSNSNK